MSPEQYRGRIDRRTRRLTLPAPKGPCRFTIEGCWGDFPNDGPDATAVVLHCNFAKHRQHSSHRLTRDTSFDLPAADRVAIEVLQAVDSTSLEVTVQPRDWTAT